MVDYATIGRRIALHRKKRNLTQANLAERLDVSVSFVAQIERGRTNISLSRLCQISDILDVDVAILVSNGDKFEDFEFKSDIEEFIKDWSAEERSMLMDFIVFVNGRKKSN